MARPQSEGLDYFPLDVDMDSDDKIEYIEAKYGLAAFGIIVKLMMTIYRQGYYMMWTERQQYVFSKRVNVDINTLSTVVNACINEELFDRNLYEKYKILTSHGVQIRYLRAVERRRGVLMISEFSLIRDEDGIKKDRILYKNLQKTVIADNNTDSKVVIADNNSSKSIVSVGNMSAETTQSKVKYITTTTTPPIPPMEDDPDFAEVISAYSDNIHPATPIEAEQLADFLGNFQKSVVLAAIHRAVKRGKRNIGYVEGILRSWEENGYDDGEPKKGEKKNGTAFRCPHPDEAENGRYKDFESPGKDHVYPWDIQPQPGGDGEAS